MVFILKLVGPVLIIKIKVPSKNTKWAVKGNETLTKNQSIVMQWNNGEGIIFEKSIILDDKYLFKINQKSTKSNKREN